MNSTHLRYAHWLGACLLGALLLSANLVPSWSGNESENAQRLYDQATVELDRENYRKAISLFERYLDDSSSKRPDAGLYWKAYAEYHNDQSTASQDTIRELMDRYPQSRWVDDAEQLYARMVESRGSRTIYDGTGTMSGDEIKIIALSGLMQENPERAVKPLRRLLSGNASTEVKSQALFLLTQSDSSEGMDLLEQIARDSSDNELQHSAINQLGIVGDERSGRILKSLFDSTDDRDVQNSILGGFMVSGRTEELFDIAQNHRDDEVRAGAIRNLAVAGEGDKLESLWRRDNPRAIRDALLDSAMITGDSGLLIELAEGNDPELRTRALEMLGAMGATQELERLSQSSDDPDTQRVLMHAFMVAGEVEPILEQARQSKYESVRSEAFQMLGVMGRSDLLKELMKNERSEDLRKQMVQALFVSGSHDEILEIAMNDSSREVQVEAIRAIGWRGSAEGRKTLLKIYKDNGKDLDFRRAAIEGLMAQDAVKELIELARSEKDPRLKAAIVQSIAATGSDEAMNYMMEILDDRE